MTFVAIGFDKFGFKTGMDFSLSVHRRKVFLAIDKRRSDKHFSKADWRFGLSDTEVFKVDAALGQAKVRSITSPSRIWQAVFVLRLILIIDTVSIQPVSDQEFFVAANLFALKRSKIEAFDVGIPSVLGIVVPFAAALDGELSEPIDNHIRNLFVSRNQLPKNPPDKVGIPLLVSGM